MNPKGAIVARPADLERCVGLMDCHRQLRVRSRGRADWKVDVPIELSESRSASRCRRCRNPQVEGAQSVHKAGREFRRKAVCGALRYGAPEGCDADPTLVGLKAARCD